MEIWLIQVVKGSVTKFDGSKGRNDGAGVPIGAGANTTLCEFLLSVTSLLGILGHFGHINSVKLHGVLYIISQQPVVEFLCAVVLKLR